MASKPSDDDPKVIDVSKPGKGKIVVNSRPLASPVVNEVAPSGDVVEEAVITAPSDAKKIIQPLNEVSVGTATEDTADTETPEPAAEPVSEPEQARDSLPTPRADKDSPIAPAEPGTDSSDAAGVDELAKTAEAKRLESQKAKEEAEKQQQLDALIASRKYFVPIGSGSKKGGSGVVIAVVAIVLLALMAGSYLYWQSTSDDSSSDPTTATTQPVSQENTADDDKAEAVDNSETDTIVTSAEKAADSVRKSELKNLQQKVEAYFTANQKYPAALADLNLTTDESTDPDGKTYAYTGTDTSYVLSIALADGTDPEAVEGVYSLQSPQQEQ